MGTTPSKNDSKSQSADPGAPAHPPPLAAPAPSAAAAQDTPMAPRAELSTTAAAQPAPVEGLAAAPSDAVAVPPPAPVDDVQMSAEEPLAAQSAEPAPMQLADAEVVQGDARRNVQHTEMASPTAAELTLPPTAIESPSMKPEYAIVGEGATQLHAQEPPPAEGGPEPTSPVESPAAESKEASQVGQCGNSKPAEDPVELADASGPKDAAMEDLNASGTSEVTQNSDGGAVGLADDGPRPDGPELKKSGAPVDGADSGPATEVIPESSHAVEVRLPPMDDEGVGGGEVANEGPSVRIVDTDFQNQGPMEGTLIEDELELLNLDLLWEELAEETVELEVEEKCRTLTCELLHYFWNQTLNEKQKDKVKMRKETDMFGMTVDQRIAIANKVASEEYKEMDEEEEAVGQGGAGESIIFKLRCGDKKRKKDTKIMTIEEDVEFVKKIDARLHSLRDHPHFQQIINEFALVMLRYFVAKMITGREVKEPEMAQACANVLKLFMENMSHKLASVWLKEVWSSFGTNHFEPIAFHCMCEYLEMWATIIPKHKSRRCALVLYMLQKMDVMIPAVDSHKITYYYGEPGDPGGVNDRLPEIMTTFMERVLDASELQWEEKAHIREAADKDGTLYEQRMICEYAKGRNTDQGFRQRDAATKDKASEEDPPRSKEGQEVDDWLCERRYLLMSALNLIKDAVYRLPMPGEGEKKKDVKLRKRNVDRIKRLLVVMKRLGWTNVLRGIQISLVYQYNENVRPEDDVLEQALGPLLRFTEGSKYTALSHIAVACYVFMALRKQDSDANDLFDFAIDGSGFEFLTPKRAFDEVMPYLLSLVSITAKPAPIAAVHLTNLFVDRIDGSWNADGAMQWRFGLVQSGRAVSVDGLAKHILRFVERVDDADVKRRQFVYKCFQNVIRKMRSPATRFSVVKELLLETQRIAVEAQLITELKDVLVYSDKVKGTDEWSEEQNDALKTRFMEVVMPRYFTPKKNSLSYISPMVSLSAAARFVALRDGHTEPEKKSEEMLRRGEYMKKYLSLGKEILRAICACSEHDIKSIPEKQLRTNEMKRTNYEAAKDTLNKGQQALLAIDHALSGL